jgi:putative tricarboxylic transport membrane protein
MTKERGGSLIFLAAGIYGLVFSVGLPFGRWNEPGPAVFPLALSILLCISGIVWFIRGKAKEETRKSAGVKEFLHKYVTAIQIVGLTGVFILLLGPLGYLLTSILYLFVLFLWVSRYKLWVAAVFAITFGAGSWVFFEKLLTTPLPKGFLPF